MTTKLITYNQLKDAINLSFQNDKKIMEFYDPDVKVESLEDIVEDVSAKILTHGTCSYIGVLDKNKVVGFFVYKEGQLISFGLSVEYRIRKYLREFFKLIKTELRGHFMVFLWNKNIRGIKYLNKHGMEIINKNNYITQLAY